MATTPINKLKVYSKILYWTPHFKVKYDIAICSSLQKRQKIEKLVSIQFFAKKQKIEKLVSIQLFIDLFLCAQLDVRWVCDALIFNLYSWMYCLGQGLPCPFCLTQGLAYISKLWLVTSSSVQTLINLSIHYNVYESIPISLQVYMNYTSRGDDSNIYCTSSCDRCQNVSVGSRSSLL